MDTWLAKAVVVAAILAMSLIRGPHIERSLQVKVASSREGALEKTLVVFVLVSGCLLAFGVLVALRLGAEERMMRDAFGRDYAAYAERSKRLIPGVW